MTNSMLIESLNSPDQPAVEADLRAFCGKNSQSFIATYHKMQAKFLHGKKTLLVSTINPAALVLNYIWFFYRKLYLYGLLIALYDLIILFTRPGFTGLILLGMISILVIATMSNYIYVCRGLTYIAKANEQNLTGQARLDYLSKSGGVSWVAAALAIAFQGAIVFFFYPSSATMTIITQ